jgi:hypothetical protein
MYILVVCELPDMTRDAEVPVCTHDELRLYGIFASVGVTSAVANSTARYI